MNVVELVNAAAKAKGTSIELAKSMGKSPARLSEWKNGKRKPDASEIAYMAKLAGLPVLITVALVEREIDPANATLWEEALGEVNAPPSLIQAGTNVHYV